MTYDLRFKNQKQKDEHEIDKGGLSRRVWWGLGAITLMTVGTILTIPPYFKKRIASVKTPKAIPQIAERQTTTLPTSEPSYKPTTANPQTPERTYYQEQGVKYELPSLFGRSVLLEHTEPEVVTIAGYLLEKTKESDDFPKPIAIVTPINEGERKTMSLK